MRDLVHQIEHVSPVAPTQQQKTTLAEQEGTSNVSFASLLKNAIEEVNEVENIADSKAEMLAQGNVDDLHDVMLSAQKAKITVEASVQVQQKVIDIYNEMMRMQV